MQTKNQIARSMYQTDFEYLSAGEKAAVTRVFNRSTHSTSAPVGDAVECRVGRLNQNGTKTCLVSSSKNVAELIEQANYTIDERKESVTALSTGLPVMLFERVSAGETYIISAEIKSA